AVVEFPPGGLGKDDGGHVGQQARPDYLTHGALPASVDRLTPNKLEPAGDDGQDRILYTFTSFGLK
ncbi:hypothetical protein, partial [Streptosporangium saharense]|uniref:hypothetical protein n=1 Tax=Streptosporangium saharense TaxID=1706840 RepID=UPI001C8699E7